MNPNFRYHIKKWYSVCKTESYKYVIQTLLITSTFFIFQIFFIGKNHSTEILNNKELFIKSIDLHSINMLNAGIYSILLFYLIHFSYVFIKTKHYKNKAISFKEIINPILTDRSLDFLFNTSVLISSFITISIIWFLFNPNDKELTRYTLFKLFHIEGYSIIFFLIYATLKYGFEATQEQHQKQPESTL